MRLTLFSLGLLGALLLGACGSTSRAPASEATLFHNARIYLGHPEWRTVEALLVADGRVVIAGSLAALAAAVGVAGVATAALCARNAASRQAVMSESGQGAPPLMNQRMALKSV